MAEGFYAYVGVTPCGCRPMCCVDEPQYAKDTAKFVADAIKNGNTVERVFVPKGETVNIFRCHHKESEVTPAATSQAAFRSQEPPTVRRGNGNLI